MPATGPVIKIENLTKSFQGANGDTLALENVDLEIASGEIFGIIGMSGAGKSTLVRCINFLERPTGGTVYFEGQDLSLLSEHKLNEIRRSMGMIFQQFNLLMQRTAEQNVRFPLEIAAMPKPEAKVRAHELLELVGISEKAEAYPAQLSGGQRQRVAIARALATNPKVLLCDEATSALDPATTQGVLALLKDINHRLGITIVVITHEMSVIESICHRVAIIDQHRIAETGNVAEVFTQPQSDAARRLFYPDGKKIYSFTSSRCCRIAFDGCSSFEPALADMILYFKQPVNIIFADTKNIEGQSYGQLVIQLPEDIDIGDKMIAYLRARGLSVEEVHGYV